MIEAMGSILLISGSLRGGSTNTAALQTVQHIVGSEIAMVYDDMASLPPFNPDLDQHPLPELVYRLRQQIDAADAVLFSTPEYAGALPGSFKNLLDWLVGGGEMYQKAVGWINVSSLGRGGMPTLP